MLEELEARLPAAELHEAWALVAFVAGREIELDEDELRGACRRALLLLAAGGDPRRGLELRGRAVSSLARDLDSASRRAELERGLASLRDSSLPHLGEAARSLLADPELAWRSFALALLADAIDD